MTNTTKFELQGFKEFADLLDALPDDLAAKTIKQAFYQGAMVVKQAAIEKCPVAEKDQNYKGKIIPAGALKKSIRIVRPTEKQSLLQDMLLYIVKAGGRAAPHAWLNEFGSGPRVQGKTGRFTGSMPAHPFMRPAFDEKGGAALDRIGMFCKVGIEKSAVALAKRLKALK